MRDPMRIRKVLKLIEQNWIKRPDQRFFQLVQNLQFELGNKSGDLHYLEDDELIKELTPKAPELWDATYGGE